MQLRSWQTAGLVGVAALIGLSAGVPGPPVGGAEPMRHEINFDLVAHGHGLLEAIVVVEPGLDVVGVQIFGDEVAFSPVHSEPNGVFIAEAPMVDDLNCFHATAEIEIALPGAEASATAVAGKVKKIKKVKKGKHADRSPTKVKKRKGVRTTTSTASVDGGRVLFSITASDCRRDIECSEVPL